MSQEGADSSRQSLVWTIRDGKLLCYQEFYDEQAAREAAGCDSAK